MQCPEKRASSSEEELSSLTQGERADSQREMTRQNVWILPERYLFKKTMTRREINKHKRKI